MKKILFSLAILVSLTTLAQSLSINPSESYFGLPNETLDASFDVTNNSDGDLEVIVTRLIPEAYDSLEGFTSTFCWGTTCYPPHINVSTNPIIINAGGSFDGFKGTVSSMPVETELTINYCFSVVDNPSDKVCTDVIFSSINPSDGVTAQTYFSADLESGIDSWTIVDYDGDGNNWSVIDFDDNEGSVLNSASYDINTGPLTPDNWIITPAINLASSNAPTLYWKAKALDQSWANENYSVYVSTQSDVNSLSSSSVSFTEFIGVTNGYELRTLDLSSFNNETVYVAFRHHDVTDMFSLNVKDISVSEILQEFVEHDISSSNYQVVDAEGGTGTFDFTVTSYGADNLSDYDFNYTINGSTSSIASNQTLSAGDQESFSFDLGIGEYTVVTSVSNSNGEVVGEEQEFDLSVVPPVPNFTLEDIYGNSHDLHEALSEGKKVLLSFFASWCGPCEESTPEVNSVWNQFGAGDEDFEVYGLTTETTDDAAVIGGLGWGAEYPEFEYSYDAYLQYFHYASSLETSGIPLYVIVCPNTQNPGFSEVSWFSEGWAPGGQSQNDMIAALQECDETIFGCISEWADNYDEFATDDDGSCYKYDCISEWADNYDELATDDDGSCELVACNYPYFFEYDSNYTISDPTLCLTYIVEGCTNPDGENYNEEANLDDGTCVVFGCTYTEAENYNPEATLQDESCIYYGCTNNTAENYNEQATENDGSCIIYGCVLSLFPNYNPEATVDDNSCNPDGVEMYGCSDETALNYDSQANTDNGSCIYQDSPEDCGSNTQEVYIPLYLPEGWGMFGFTCIEPMDVIDAFAPISDKLIIVKDNDGNPYLPEFNFNGLGDLVYSRGYQLKITEEIEDFSFCPTIIATENTPQREVGDLAEGGIVFYVDETGQHGLVAAMQDIEGIYEWGCHGTSISGTDGTAIGTGYQNTLDIVSGCSETPIAASVALAYESEGYSDWYLPSKDELIEMYNTIGNGSPEGDIGGFGHNRYWSSSEDYNNTAWSVGFGAGATYGYEKDNNYGVRVIRAF